MHLCATCALQGGKYMHGIREQAPQGRLGLYAHVGTC
jgi:hypothetical protein